MESVLSALLKLALALKLVLMPVLQELSAPLLMQMVLLSREHAIIMESVKLTELAPILARKLALAPTLALMPVLQEMCAPLLMHLVLPSMEHVMKMESV
jgi:hypothetical protein